jgi:prophage antirepressor-like protein
MQNNQLKINISSVADQAADTSGDTSPVTFSFENNSVRIVMGDGVESFVAKDLAPVLGFRNARQAVRSHVAKHDRRGVQIVDSIGRPQTLLAVNESGLYALVLGSRNPKARAFKDFVTGTVLPEIRRTGEYPKRDQAPALLAGLAKALCCRGAAKSRQLNRVIAHRDGRLSLRVGKHWLRRVEPNTIGFPLAHGLREGLALSLLHESQKPEGRLLLH